VSTTTFRIGLHSIESSIAAEAKITQLMRRVELLEVKEQNSPNHINPPQMPKSGLYLMSCLDSHF